MARAYSEDLRVRLVRLVESGTSARSAAKLFEVSASTAVKWMQRWRRERSVAPNPVRGHRRARLNGHSGWLFGLIETKPDLTLEEIRMQLKKRGVRVSLGAGWSFFQSQKNRFKKKRVHQGARWRPRGP